MKHTSKQSTYELYGRATPNRSTSNEARFKTKHVRPMKKHTAGLASDEKGSEIIAYILWASNGQTRSASEENCCLRKRHAQAVGEYKVQFGQHEDDGSFKTKDVRSHLGVR
jgi:hypothetical protein